MKRILGTTKILIFITVFVCSLFVGAGKRSEAALGVPNFTGFDPQSIMKYTKDFVLDNAAYVIAKSMIQTMTADIVDWINKGFDGSPLFLQDTEGFFLRSADQLTGAFIAGSGPLTRLCGPFNLDLRLNLALSQVQTARTRYNCTLKNVIANAQNASVNASVGTDPNGMTLGDIMEGDVSDNPNAISVNGVSIDNTDDYLRGEFNQGGWPAFVALTSEPQNNPYGAYMQARRDLMRQQALEAEKTNRDLDRGKGFLSFKQCKEIGRAPSDDIAANEALDAKTKGMTSLKYELDGDYMVYKSCTTETPGSVVSGKLQSSVDSPVRQLELADSLGEIIDAALNQMINQLVTKGLASLSDSSGGQVSVTNNLRMQATKMQERVYTTNQISAIPQVENASTTLGNLIAIYEDTKKILTETKTSIESTCYGQEIYLTEMQAEIARVDTAISNNDLRLNAAKAKIAELNSSIKGLDLDGFSTAEEQDAQVKRSNRAVQIATDAYANALNDIPIAEKYKTDALKIQSEANTLVNKCM